MTTRRQYSKEFKLDAVSLVVDQGYSRSEAARHLGIDLRILGRWVKEHQTDDGQAFRGNGKLTPEQEEIRKLKAQVKRLEMERDILKRLYPNLSRINALQYTILTVPTTCFRVYGIFSEFAQEYRHLRR